MELLTGFLFSSSDKIIKKAKKEAKKTRQLSIQAYDQIVRTLTCLLTCHLSNLMFIQRILLL